MATTTAIPVIIDATTCVAVDPGFKSVFCTSWPLTRSYVDSCTLEATITRGMNAESPRDHPRTPSN